MALKILHTTAFGTLGILFVCVTLSLASSLLWLAEVIEEHSRTAKTVGKRIIYAVIIFHCLLYITEDYLPWKPILFSIFCHTVYILNFRTFPVISLTSISFISSCVLAILNHFLWFLHFDGISQAARARESKWKYRHPSAPKLDVPSFLDVSTFFAICVWLVPLFLFLSLTANDNTLPMTRGQGGAIPSAQADDKKQRHSLFLSLLGSLTSSLPGGFLRTTSRQREGILPNSINSSSSPRAAEFSLRSDNPLPPGSPNALLSPVSPSFHTRQSSPTKESWVSVEGSQDGAVIGSPAARSPTNARKRFILESPPPRRK